MIPEDLDEAWQGMPAGKWKCPKCHVSSPSKDWSACDMPCDDCGTHAGRVCPACDEAFDHVFGAPEIALATKGH
jgi:hypothetical protein